MEQHKPEKPFMIQQLIFHGVFATLLLVSGWLFPVQYNTLHPKALEQAGLSMSKSSDGNHSTSNPSSPDGQSPDQLKEFISNRYSSGDSESVRALLELGDEQARDGEAPETVKKFPNALSIFVNPARRVHYMEILEGRRGRKDELYGLKEVTPQYRSAAALLAYLDGHDKLHSDLRKDLLTYMDTGQTNQVERTMHATITLGTRLSFEQMGEITSRTSSPEALIDFAKIAKIQTILYPFNSYDTTPDGQLEANELRGLDLGKEENFSKWAGSDNIIDLDDWAKIPTGDRPTVGDGEKSRPGELKDFDIRSNSISLEELKAVHSPLVKTFKEIAGTDQQISREEWINLGFVPLHLTKFPIIYTASVWSENPGGVANYLMKYGRQGEEWLAQAMNGPARQSGSGALKALLERQLPLTRGGPALVSVASFSYKNPHWALLVKYLLIGLGCFVIIRAWNSFFVLKAVDRASLQALLFRRRAMAVALLVFLFGLSEPMLFQSVYSSEYQIAINVPQLSETENIETLNNTNTMLAANTTLLVNVLLIVFFAAIQIVVFTSCTNKIREIISGKGDSRLKLQLLENEDNLFDMGLYIGIAGTALTLAAKLLIETDAINLSAAYASNIFGILCVALVKIKHLRPTREALIRGEEDKTGSLGTA